MSVAAANKATSHAWATARLAIQARRFIGWQGLPPGCTAHALFGVGAGARWGEQQLGTHFQPARSHLLDIDGYDRAMTYVRNGAVALFDGMNPSLDGGWQALSDDLGTPEATLDWIHARTIMPGGERVYSSRGITILLNPDNDFVVYVSLYVPVTVDEYIERLQPNREKRLSKP